MGALLVTFVLAAPRVFFAHQDVGQNVVDGVSAYERGALTLEAAPQQKGTLGERLAAFRAETERRKPDVAVFELGWRDVTADTDVDALFAVLEQGLAGLPVLTCTVPLTSVGRGLQAAVKNRLASGAFGERENVKRHLLNQKLRAAHPRLFDLAKLQAGACTFEREGKTWPCADDALTEDGAKLNAKGRKLAAAAFVAAVKAQ